MPSGSGPRRTTTPRRRSKPPGAASFGPAEPMPLTLPRSADGHRGRPRRRASSSSGRDPCGERPACPALAPRPAARGDRVETVATLQRRPERHRGGCAADASFTVVWGEARQHRGLRPARLRPQRRSLAGQRRRAGTPRRRCVADLPNDTAGCCTPRAASTSPIGPGGAQLAVWQQERRDGRPARCAAAPGGRALAADRDRSTPATSDARPLAAITTTGSRRSRGPRSGAGGAQAHAAHRDPPGAWTRRRSATRSTGTVDVGDIAADGDGGALTASARRQRRLHRRLRRRRAALQRASRSPSGGSRASRWRSPPPPTTTGRAPAAISWLFGDGARRERRVGLAHLRGGRDVSRDRARDRRRRQRHRRSAPVGVAVPPPPPPPVPAAPPTPTATASATPATTTTAPSARGRSRPSTPRWSPATCSSSSRPARRARRSAAAEGLRQARGRRDDPGRRDARHHARPRQGPQRGDHRAQAADRPVLPRALRDPPGHVSSGGPRASSRTCGSPARRSGAPAAPPRLDLPAQALQAARAAAVRQRQGLVPHQRPQRRGDRARHALERPGPLRRHAGDRPEGRVEVRDLVKRKTIIVRRAGPTSPGRR